MKFLAATIVVASCFAVTPALAYDGPQPLTRAACDAAHLAWDDGANVCSSEEAPQTTAALEVPDASASPAQAAPNVPAEIAGQPLTREACDLAGETWNDNTNICDVAMEPVPVDVAAAASSILINIDKANQKMVVWVDGVEKYTWPVSTGRPGYATPSGDYTPGSMNEMWYSRQWDNAPMPHAIFFTKSGHAIHGSNEVRNLGRPASHGCVRISPKNAATLYDLVEENGLDRTKIVLAGMTPGGDYVSPAANARPRTLAPVEEVQPVKRGGGLFKRLFGKR
ncbi:MAG: L,D-transpeptidase [Hyphomicrobiales bacterium]